jgi:hypothetical protein
MLRYLSTNENTVCYVIQKSVLPEVSKGEKDFCKNLGLINT